MFVRCFCCHSSVGSAADYRGLTLYLAGLMFESWWQLLFGMKPRDLRGFCNIHVQTAIDG